MTDAARTRSEPDATRISFGDPTYVELVDFYHWEAELLDNDRFEEWLDLLAEDLRYLMPTTVTRRRSAGSSIAERSGVFADNKAAISARVRRITQTTTAWSDDPPSRIRRFVSQLRVRRLDAGEFEVTSHLLVTKSRWNDPHFELLVGERRDVVRRSDRGFVVSRRTIVLDQATPRSTFGMLL